MLLSSYFEYSSVSDWIIHVFEGLGTNVIFSVGILIIFGLIGGKLISLLKFPKVTGYIIMGVLIGPSVIGLLSEDMLVDLSIISKIAIGLIGYTIGLELKFKKLKKTGKQVTIITISQAILTAVLVCGAALVYYKSTGNNYAWTYALILGAIATATAPGPIIAVVKSYRTKGPVTDVLLPLVALDDVIGIILFAIMLSFGASFVTGTVSVSKMFLTPLIEIGLSVSIGCLFGFLLQFVLKKLNREQDAILLMIVIGFVFTAIGFGIAIEASAILLPMTVGIVLTNSLDEKYQHRLMKLTDLLGAPVLLAFFTIAGAQLELELLKDIGIIGLIYLTVRVVGKIFGARFSAKAVKAPKNVYKYLGFTLIPQAGVAIDMALTTRDRFFTDELYAYRHIGLEIMAIVLAATVIYEVLGLIIVKTALYKAGEIDAAVTNWE